MSLPTGKEVEAFIGPLRSKSAVFFLDGRETNLVLSRFVLSCLAARKDCCRIADLNAFYASNMGRIAPDSTALLKNVALSFPPSELIIEDWIVDFLIRATDAAMIILDDLNTLYHLAFSSASDHTSNRLNFLMTLSSFLARTRSQTIFSTAYSHDRSIQGGRGLRSLSKMGDVGVSVHSRGEELAFECVRGKAWKSNAFTVRVSL